MNIQNETNTLDGLTYYNKYNSVYTVLPAKNDSDVMFCLNLLSKTLTCTLHLS